MEASSFKKSIEEWLVELNDPQAEHRRDALTALVGSGTLDDRLVNELKLIARGDPDLKIQLLAKKVLKAHGIKIHPQTSYQPGVKQTQLLFSSEFWMGFFLCPILNFILFLGLQSFALIANRNIIALQIVLNIVLLIFFWLTRKNVALGMLAAFVFLLVTSICLVLYISYLSWSCWPDGCAVPQ
jgi:hypothetical protein